MTQQKNPKDPGQAKSPNPSQKPNGPYQEPPKHRPEGREHEVHEEILKRRMRGGPEATPEAYTRALEQWKNLPGSVVRPPTDVILPLTEEPSELADQSSPTSTPDEEKKDESDEEKKDE